MRELHTARSALVKDRPAALNRQKAIRSAPLRRQNAQRLHWIAAQLAAIDAELVALCAADPDLKERLAILTSIPGLGQISALALSVEMPELGSLEHPQAASLAGLAPIARASGQFRGRRSIRGGRAGLRQALYMPALVAARFNPDLKAKYQALIQAGKAAKLAVTAMMRKLLVLANALLRDRRAWSPKLLSLGGESSRSDGIGLGLGSCFCP